MRIPLKTFLIVLAHSARSIETLGSQQYVITDSRGKPTLDERVVPVSSDGQPAAFSSQSPGACSVHVGCYVPKLGSRPTIISSGDVVDPFKCMVNCARANFSVAAMNGQNCGCSASIHSVFGRSGSQSSCSFSCQTSNIRTPLCGGAEDHWSVYRCYSYEQLTALAVDPFRDIAFKTVTIDWLSESDPPPDGRRESHFLFASDLSTGFPLFQYHIAQVDPDQAGKLVQFSGLRFDVDSSRLVGLIFPSLEDMISGSSSPKLVIIDINTSDITLPVLTIRSFVILSSDYQTLFSATSLTLGDPTNGIISRNEIQSYLFSMAGETVGTSLLIFVDITSPNIGNAFLVIPLDCVATQLAVNDYYGDVAILAPRRGSVQFIAVATVYVDTKTGRLSAQSYWDPTGVDLRFVAAVSDTQNLNLIAGVSASIPMQNQSCHGIMLYQPSSDTAYIDDRELLLSQSSSGNSVPSVVCFDIRKQGFMQLWGSSNGTARTTQNGTVQNAITMNLFQTDPGYPMTLSRPEMKLCEISATALTITVKFDAVTLMGGKAVDSNNDGIPESANLETQILGPTVASACFTESTLGVLTGATCHFLQGDVLIVTLDRTMSTVTFNDALCIKPNFICRSQGTQWSPYANGCCKVTLPPDLPPPKPVLVATPSLTVDVCSDLTLDFSDSQYCGRGCNFEWQLVSVTSTGGSLSYTADVLAQFAASLSQLLTYGRSSVGIPSALLARSAIHTFNVTVTSSWKKTSFLQFSVEKLAEPAPTITIPGQSRIVATQMSDYTISSVGKISGCSVDATSVGGKVLNYQWTMTNCSVAFDRARILATQNVLHIPAGTHACPSGAGWFDSSLNKVMCEQCVATVSVFLQGAPLRNSTASVTVAVVKSAVVVKCFNPDRGIATRGPVWFLNCASSVDLDDPSASPFQGTYIVSCTRQSDGASPCFSEGTVFTNTMPSCMTDFTQPRVEGDGGAMYPQVILSAKQSYCRLSRGIFAINTNLLPVGKYSFNVSITHFDTMRSASKVISIDLANIPMPKVSMTMFGTPSSNGKYPVSTSLSVEASVTLDIRVIDVRYAWLLLARQLNREYDALAAQRAANRGDMYSVPQYIYIAGSTLEDCKSQNKASYQSTSPTLVLGANCLNVGMDYALRLNVTWTQAEAFFTYSELLFSTASGPPRGGSLSVVGAATSTCDIAKTLSADGWASEDTPLVYRFGHLIGPNGSSKYWFTDSSQTVRTYTGLLPCGSNTVFVQVTSAAGEFTFAFQQVISDPPPDPYKTASTLAGNAGSLLQSDPTQALSFYMAAVSLAPNDTSLVESITNAVRRTQCSSADCGNRVLVFLNTVSGYQTTDPLLNAVEDNVKRISGNDPAVLEHSQTVFDSLSAVLGSLAGPRTSTSVRNRVALAARRSSSWSHSNSTALLITDCADQFCDRPGTLCVRENQVGHSIVTCCDVEFRDFGCTEPPCWIPGKKCRPGQVDVGKFEDFTRGTKDLATLQEREEGLVADAVARNNALMKRQFEYNQYTSRFQPEVQEVLEADERRKFAFKEGIAINASELVARMESARQAVAEKIITTLVRDQPPIVFETDQFTITIGKTTDMSSALPVFTFPSSFTVPRSSPDVPTANNPVTGFSYYFVEYKNDIFSWALNAPQSSAASAVVSLKVMKADPSLPLVHPPNEDPIRVFADRQLLAADACMKFAVNKLEWQGAGVVNDGNGCLVSTQGNVGIFLDPVQNDRMESELVGTVDSGASMDYSYNFKPTIVLVVLLLLHVGFLFWGRRQDAKSINPPRTIFLGGDGVTEPISVNDPIAYGDRSAVNRLFSTFRNLLRLRLAIAWPLTYNPAVSRPLRVGLLTSFVTNCTVLGTLLMECISWDVYALGVINAILSSIVYILVRTMVDRLPHPAKMRISTAKRRTSGGETVPIRLTSRLGIDTHNRPAIDELQTSSPILMPTDSGAMQLVIPVDEDVPPPPPPITEDSKAFIRRVKDVYSEKSHREHEMNLITQEMGEYRKPVPEQLRMVLNAIIITCLVGCVLVAIIIVPLKTAFLPNLSKTPQWTVVVMLAIGVSVSALDPTTCFIEAIKEDDRFNER